MGQACCLGAMAVAVARAHEMRKWADSNWLNLSPRRARAKARAAAVRTTATYIDVGHSKIV